jgi:hypothetical protein
MKNITINFGLIEMAFATIAVFLMFPSAKTPYQVAVLCFLVLVYVAIKNYAAVQPQLSLGRYFAHLKRQRKILAVLCENKPSAIVVMDREIEEVEEVLLKEFWKQLARSVFCSTLCLYALYQLLKVLLSP